MLHLWLRRVVLVQPEHCSPVEENGKTTASLLSTFPWRSSLPAPHSGGFTSLIWVFTCLKETRSPVQALVWTELHWRIKPASDEQRVNIYFCPKELTICVWDIRKHWSRGKYTETIQGGQKSWEFMCLSLLFPPCCALVVQVSALSTLPQDSATTAVEQKT